MTTPTAPAKNRISSIDLLRGTIIVTMALDHVRDFFHFQASTGKPKDIITTTPPLFFTRWISHFCAPTFVFLAGTSAYLGGTKKTKSDLSSFLLKRGIWLIMLELVVIIFVLTFNPFYDILILQSIWTIGTSMVLLSFSIRLPISAILAIGLSILMFHNLLDYTEAARNDKVGYLWDLLRQGRFTFYKIFHHHSLLILYAFLPWFGVMWCGYCFGNLYDKNFPEARRKRILIRLGLGIIILFVMLRFINVYGEPVPWSHQRSRIYTFLSFLNTCKYPPSLMYLCMTLSPPILSLAFIEHAQIKLTRFFVVFGWVPFFYYVIHFFYIHLLTVLTVIAFFISRYTFKDIVPKNTPFLFRPDNFGYSLPIVYLIWFFMIITLYPLCKRYNKYKSTHYQWWLS